MSSIHLYAEVLQNIKQINFYAELQTDQDQSTEINVFSDGQFITVQHDDQKARLLLPLAVSGTANMTIPARQAKEISVRLEVEDTNGVVPEVEDTTPKSPWSAASLGSDASLSCRKCDSVLSLPGSTLIWKDLPSENWAEMMDFWHCHKPCDEEDQTHQHRDAHVADSKGYGTTSQISVVAGIAFVDDSSFLVAKEDFKGVRVSHPDHRSSMTPFHGLKRR